MRAGRILGVLALQNPNVEVKQGNPAPLISATTPWPSPISNLVWFKESSIPSEFPTRSSHHSSEESSTVTLEQRLHKSPHVYRENIISSLDIVDPDFYSVFDDTELELYFNPVTPRIPTYVWDHGEPFSKMVQACLQDVPKDKRLEHENEWNLYNGVMTSRHREYNKDSALLHYVPFYMQRCADPYRSEIDAIVLESPEFKRYNGANFIIMWNFFIFVIQQMEESSYWFEAGQSPSRPLAAQICFEHHVAPDNCVCHVVDSSGPASVPQLIGEETDITDRRWPPYDTSKYTNFSDFYIQTRPFNFIFVGQMDNRIAYQDRVQCAHKCDGFAKPSIYIQTGSGNGPPSDTPINYSECEAPLDISANETIKCLFPGRLDVFKLMKLSKYGWHHRGDSPHSARLTDLFNTLTLPVITSKLLGDSSTPYQCTIPYDALSFYVPPERFDQCGDVVDEITNMPSIELEKKLRLLYYYRPYYVNSQFSWEALLRETVSTCLSSVVLTDFNLSMSDFPCKYNNKFKAQRMPRIDEVDEAPSMHRV